MEIYGARVAKSAVQVKRYFMCNTTGTVSDKTSKKPGVVDSQVSQVQPMAI